MYVCVCVNVYCCLKVVFKSPQLASECGYNLALDQSEFYTLCCYIALYCFMFPKKTANIFFFSEKARRQCYLAEGKVPS